MDLQEKILKQYLSLFKKPTLKSIAADTGIQMTRVFRILNGSPMKLSEYQTFRKKVAEKIGMTCLLEDLALESSIKLSPDVIRELEFMMKRKLQLWSIKNIKQENINQLA